MAFETRALPSRESLGPTMSTARSTSSSKSTTRATSRLDELIAGTKFASSDLESIIARPRAGRRRTRSSHDAAQVRPRVSSGEIDRAEQRRRAGPTGAEAPRRQLRLAGHLARPLRRGVRRSFRGSGSAVAGRERRQSSISSRLTVPTTADVGQHALVDLRPVGARLLPRLPAERAKSVAAVIEHVANWQFVGERLVEVDREKAALGYSPTK